MKYDKFTLKFQNVMHHKSYEALSGSDKKVVLSTITDLLKAGTEEKFDEVLLRKSSWDHLFLKYFNQFLLTDVRQSSKYKTECLGIYYPVAGVSNNVR